MNSPRFILHMQRGSVERVSCVAKVRQVITLSLNVRPVTMEQSLAQLLLGTQSGDGTVRRAAEQEIAQLSENSVDELAKTLLSIAASSLDLPIRQSALLVLKTVVQRNWSIGFDSFQGPAISPQVKHEIRQQLLDMVGSDQSKVNSATALLLARIASVDFPEEWPDLLETIISMIEGNISSKITGALTVLSELLNDSLSESDFFSFGLRILDAIYNIASSQDQEYESRTIAVQCFVLAINFFLMAEDSQQAAMEAFAGDVLLKWSELFAAVLGDHDSNNSALAQFKIEVMSAITQMESAFPDQTGNQFAVLTPPVINDLRALASLSEVRRQASLSATSHLTMDDLVVAEVGFLRLVFDSDIKGTSREINRNESAVSEIVELFIQLCQLTEEMEDLDLNEYVTNETDMSVEKVVRAEVASVLGLIRSPYLLTACWQKASAAFNASASWVMREASLYVFGNALLDASAAQISQLTGDYLKGIVQLCTMEVHEPLLLSRIIIVSSIVAKSLGGRLDQATRQECLVRAIETGISASDDIVKISCVIAVNRFASESKRYAALSTYQTALFGLIASLVDDAAEDTPSFLMEFFLRVIKINPAVAINSPDVLKLLLALVAKDTANIELTMEARDVLEELVSDATDNGSFDSLAENVFASLFPVLSSVENFEYTPDFMLALDLISGVVDKGPTPLPPNVCDLLMDPLYTVIMNSSDAQILQGASEAFSALVEHSSEQLKTQKSASGQTGPQVILSVASRLLEPNLEESAALAAGRLVAAIISRFNVDLGEILDQLLKATAMRLATAESLSLQEVSVTNLARMKMILILESCFCILRLGSSEPSGRYQRPCLYSDRGDHGAAGCA